jgi:hypothetical protein
MWWKLVCSISANVLEKHLTLKTDAASCSEILVPIDRNTRHNVSEDSTLSNHRFDHLKYYFFNTILTPVLVQHEIMFLFS